MRIVILAFALWVNCLNLNAQKPLIVQNATSYQIKSAINNRTYLLSISVPEGYSTDKKYPVFYLLDGYYTAAIAHGAHRTLEFFKEIEEVIVVTISGNEKNKNEWFINRWSDYTYTNDPINDTAYARSWDLPKNSLLSGKGDQFLQIIKNEIIPLIEKNYSTNGKRGISGHSLGGLYVANLLFNAGDVFEKFGINSPSFKMWNNNDIMLAEKAFSEKHNQLKAKLILTFGGLESPNNIKNLWEFEALLKKHNPNIETTCVIFDSETHASVIAAMISRNLLNLYSKKK
jgi:predicted alpha/beta superfamily hydrolase